MLFLAIGWDLPFSAVLIMNFGFVVAGIFPSAPGYLGVYQAAAVLSLSIYGIEQSAAVLYAFSMQFSLLVTSVFMGGCAIWPLLKGRTIRKDEP